MAEKEQDIDNIIYDIAKFYEGGITIDWLEKQPFTKVIKAKEQAIRINKNQQKANE